MTSSWPSPQPSEFKFSVHTGAKRNDEPGNGKGKAPRWLNYNWTMHHAPLGDALALRAAATAAPTAARPPARSRRR